jgi:hypothetical protein
MLLKKDFSSFSVEANHVGEVFPGTRADIHNYLQAQGYIFDDTVGKKVFPGTIHWMYK